MIDMNPIDYFKNIFLKKKLQNLREKNYTLAKMMILNVGSKKISYD